MPGKVAITATEKHFGDVTSIVHHKGHIFSAGSDGKLKVCMLNEKHLRIFSKTSKVFLIFVDF